MRGMILLVMTAGLALSGCASGSGIPLTTAALPATTPVSADPVRGTPVVPGRPARMYVMVGFKEADCSPLSPQLQVSTPPAKGEVTFKPNQATTVMQSGSGKCTGNKLPGTGIYYTAKPGAQGADTFTVTATSGSSAATTRTFQVRIID